MTHAVVEAARALELTTSRLVGEGLAGLALELHGSSPELHRIAARQAAHRLVAEREIHDVLVALRDVEVAPWKGLAIAALWPPGMRPVGDLDLLVRMEDLPRAVTTLEARGYRRAPEAAAGRWRRGPTGVELLPPMGQVTAIDLHVRPFRSIGHRIDVDPLIARAQSGTLAGAPVRVVDPIDHAHLVLVHAAKHALSLAKWRLDVVAALAALDDRQKHELHARSRAARTERPVALAVDPERNVLAGICRRAWQEPALCRRDRYVLELRLEPGMRAKARMVLGFLESIGGMKRGHA